MECLRNVGIGTTTPSVALDIGSKTDGIRIPNGTTAQQPACSSSIAGTMRYNSQTTFMEFCDGTAWNALPKLQSAAPPTTPSGAGYFVLTNTTWTGNLGGRAGADAKCLTELTSTYTNWMGYTDANTRGLLIAAKVKAFICDSSVCNNLTPLSTYYYAVANQPGVGGATFTADSSGLGPGDSTSWAAANRFGGTFSVWLGRNSTSATYWANSVNGNSCTNWSTSSVGAAGRSGATGYTDQQRWYIANSSCDQSFNLICIVSP